MDDRDKELIGLMIRDLLREEMPKLCPPHRCLVEEAGITIDEHKDHHKVIKKIAGDVGTARRAFLAGVVTTITGGILGLLWLYLKGVMGK